MKNGKNGRRRGKIKYQATLNTILSPYVILSGKCEKIFTEKNKTKRR